MLLQQGVLVLDRSAVELFEDDAARRALSVGPLLNLEHVDACLAVEALSNKD